MFALVFNAEEAAFPHVRESVAAVVFGRAFLKAETFPRGIGGGWRGVLEDVAQVKEMLLRGGALFQVHLAPLRYEFRDRHDGATLAGPAAVTRPKVTKGTLPNPLPIGPPPTTGKRGSRRLPRPALGRYHLNHPPDRRWGQGQRQGRDGGFGDVDGMKKSR